LVYVFFLLDVSFSFDIRNGRILLGMGTQEALQTGARGHAGPKLAIYLLTPTDPPPTTEVYYHHKRCNISGTSIVWMISKPIFLLRVSLPFILPVHSHMHTLI